MASDDKPEKNTPEPGGEQSSAERPGEVEQRPAGEAARPAAADPLVAGKARRGMFSVSGSGDTSGFGGLRLPAHVAAPAERPFGGWFDDFADEFGEALVERGIPRGAVQ